MLARHIAHHALRSRAPVPIASLNRRCLLSTPTPKAPEPTTRKIIRRSVVAARYCAWLALSAATGVVVIGGGIFLHDWFTYVDRHVDRVPVSPLALHPENGGPRNLPIAKVLVDDEEDEENKKLAHKPKLVIVGGGWGVRHLHRGVTSQLMLWTGCWCTTISASRRLPYHCCQP